MKPDKQLLKKQNMDALNAFVREVSKKADIRLEFINAIHLRITIKGKWVDFWPTTGKWYDPSRNGKGGSVETLINILRMKTGTELPPHPGLVKSPLSIRERLAIIDLQVSAIRAELFKTEKVVQAPLPCFMDDALDEKPYDDSWAKGDPFEKDEPPWPL